ETSSPPRRRGGTWPSPRGGARSLPLAGTPSRSPAVAADPLAPRPLPTPARAPLPDRLIRCALLPSSCSLAQILPGCEAPVMNFAHAGRRSAAYAWLMGKTMTSLVPDAVNEFDLDDALPAE